MASRNCWKCGTHAHHVVVDEPSQALGTWMAACKCTHCGAISVGVLNSSTGPWANPEPRDVAEIMNDAKASISWQPRLRGEPRNYDQAVPATISAMAEEAWRCYRDADAYRWATMGARATVEAIANHEKCTARNLEAQIDALHAKQIIGPGLREAGHEIRDSGNDVAHVKYVDDPPTREDCEELLGLMDDLLEEVYERPARIKKRQAARDAKKAAKQPPAAP